jgi:hypothetical protein
VPLDLFLGPLLISPHPFLHFFFLNNLRRKGLLLVQGFMAGRLPCFWAVEKQSIMLMRVWRNKVQHHDFEIGNELNGCEG